MSQRKWAVLIRTYTEHKLVVTRLNGFIAVESPKNRKKRRFSAEAQRLYIRFRYAYKLYLSYTSLYFDKSPADHAHQRHIIAVYVRPILPIFGFGRCGRFQGPLESWFMGLWLC